MTKIELRNICKSYDDTETDVEVLRDISFNVSPGEFVCIVGASGGGKSTLLRILARLEEPSSGEIVNLPNKFGFVFQNSALFPWLNVEHNIGFGLKMQGVDPAQIQKRVTKEVERMKLTGFEKAHPKELSGGMKQRVGIARALAINPPVLFLDEPFSALDEINAKKLREDLLQIWHETKVTIIMVTHLVEEAVLLSDKILVFSKRPATVLEQIKNDLPRPRNSRSNKFYELVDRTTKYLT